MVPGLSATIMPNGRFRWLMAATLEANLAILAGLSSLGFGIILAVVGGLAAKRVGSSKLGWVSAGFLLLALQGGYFAWRVVQDRFGAGDLLVPSYLGLFALLLLYVAVYRRP